MSQGKAPKRKWDVTIVLVGVFLLGIANLWLLRGLSRQAELLIERGVLLSPQVQMVFAAVWAAVFLLATFLLWFRSPVSRRLIPVSVALFAIYNGILLFGFIQSPVTRSGFGLDLILYLSAVAFAWWSLHRPPNRSYFKS